MKHILYFIVGFTFPIWIIPFFIYTVGMFFVTEIIPLI